MGIDLKYKIMFFSGIFLLFVVGVFVGFKANDIFHADEEVIQTASNQEDNPVNSSKVDIYDEQTTPTISKKYDIELVYEDCYTTCDDTITKKEIIYNTSLEELKEKEAEKQDKEGKVYKIKEESNEKLVYSRNIPQNCPNHFRAVLEDDEIIIYNVVNEGVETVYRKISTEDKLLRDDMKEELEEGLTLDSLEELNLLIEDLES